MIDMCSLVKIRDPLLVLLEARQEVRVRVRKLGLGLLGWRLARRRRGRKGRKGRRRRKFVVLLLLSRLHMKVGKSSLRGMVGWYWTLK